MGPAHLSDSMRAPDLDRNMAANELAAPGKRGTAPAQPAAGGEPAVPPARRTMATSAGVGGMESMGAVASDTGSAGVTAAAGSRPALPVAGAIASEAAGAGQGAEEAAGKDATTSSCQTGMVQANEVVFLGESFIAQTGAIPRLTSELAREAGVIGMNESYRSFAVSGTQLTTGEIPAQYARAKAAAPVKIVLMDGGGNDLLIGSRCMRGFDASCKEVVDVVADMFADFQADAVSDVVYFFYPDPMGIGANIKEAMDILRPEMKKFCDQSASPRCSWVDQRESWEGHYDAYTSDGIHPTEEGSEASARQIWDAMVEHCVAQ